MKDNGIWKRNSGDFKITENSLTEKIRMLKFLSNRETNGAKMFINPNEDQKYKAFFGMDFLTKYRIDIIDIQGMIMWHGIGVPLKTTTNEDCDVLDKSNITGNKYANMKTKI